MVSLKMKAAKLAKIKTDIESQKQALQQTIANMNYQQKNIQRAIQENQNMINQKKKNMI